MASSRARAKPVLAEPVDQRDLDGVPGDRERARRGRRGDRHHRADRFRPLQCHLEAHHPPERPAHDQRDARNSQGVEQRPVGPRLVTRGDRRERRPVRPAGCRIRAARSGRAVAAAEQVRAQDADPVRVECQARSDEGRPPVARGVRGSREGVDDEDLRRVRRTGAVVAVGDAQRGEPRPGDELERPEVAPHDPPRPERGDGRRPCARDGCPRPARLRPVRGWRPVRTTRAARARIAQVLRLITRPRRSEGRWSRS